MSKINYFNSFWKFHRKVEYILSNFIVIKLTFRRKYSFFYNNNNIKNNKS